MADPGGATLRLAVDIGGTFTDVTAFERSTGRVVLGKALSTPADLTDGIMAAMGRAGVPAREAGLLIHGSTVVINAILERRGAPTALVTTRGFRDLYEIGRINRPESFNLFFRKHRSLVPRDLIFEVPERALADGTEYQALDEAAAREVARRIADLGIESVGIVFLHSYAAPDHEARMRDILLEVRPKLFVTASHELSREYREYERTSTTAANAYVGPIVSRYLVSLERRLQSDGFRGSLLIMQSNGGLSDVATARRQCVQMMESGPAGGVVGTTAVCEALGLDRAISFDMGGTTAKTCVIRRGSAELSPDYFVGGYNEGLPIRIPVLDIKEVGTGGGSVAWIDAGGALHVGPQSAGAEPGPACYGRGGSEPTITDADVVLGRMSPERFLGGEMQLDVDAAVRAIRQRVAEPLSLDLERAADGILAIGVASMADAVRAVTTERGLDPRDFTLVAYGGGGPPHAVAVARYLAIRRVIVPVAPAHFSAFGMLLADLRRDLVLTRFRKLAEADMGEMERLYEGLESQGMEALVAAGVGRDRVVFQRAADMRYVGQEHAVAIRVPARVDTEGVREEIKRAFDAAHELRFSHSAPEEPAEVVSLRVSAIGRAPRPDLPRIAAGGAEPPGFALRGRRAVVLDHARDAVPCAVYDREALLDGNVIRGPAVVEETGSTTLLGPWDRLTVNEYGHLVIELGES